MSRRYRFAFRFTDDNHLQVTENDRPYPLFPLGTNQLLLRTITSLVRYVENTEEDSCDSRLIELLGRYLFEYLFTPESSERNDLRSSFIATCRAEATEVTFAFDAAALRNAQFPWEFLWVPKASSSLDGNHIAALDHVRVTMARYGGRVISPAEDVLKVLYIRYGPTSQADIASLSPMLESLRKEVQNRTGRPALAVKSLEGGAITFAAIKTAVEKHKPHLLHLSGHGERDAFWLANVPDRARLDGPLGWGGGHEPGKDFEAHFAAFEELFTKHVPQVLLLDACWTDSWQGELEPTLGHYLLRTVPAVIAMRYRITNEASVHFAAEFYRAALEGRPISEAVQRARHQVIASQPPLPGAYRAAGTPVLYARESVALCAPLLEPEAEPGQQAGPMREESASCPYCDCQGVWAAGRLRCAFCQVRFRCSDDACFAKWGAYTAPTIAAPPSGCPNCEVTFSEPTRERHGWAAEQVDSTDRFAESGPARRRPHITLVTSP